MVQTNLKYHPRFFFFNSLRNSKDPIAIDAANYADTALSLNNLDFDEEEFLSATLAGIKLLYNMYEFEKNNEIRLIQEKLQPFLNNFKSGKYKELGDCIQDNSIDYINFMRILKLIEDDTESNLQLLEGYSEKLNTLSDITDELNKNKSYTEIKTSRASTIETAKIQSQQNLTPELANLLHDFIYYNTSNQNQHSQELQNALQQHVIPMILQGQSTLKLKTSEAEMAFYANLISQANKIARAQQKVEKDTEKNLYDRILNVLQNITEDDPEFEQFKILGQRLLEHEDILQSEGKQLQHKLEMINSEKLIMTSENSFSGLKKNVRAELEKLIKDKNPNAEFTLEVSDSKKTTNLEFDPHRQSDKTQYVRWAINQLLPEKKDAPLTEVISILNKLLKTSSQRKEIITITTEHGSALNLAVINDTIVTALDGYLNNKNDATLFTIGKAAIQTTDGQAVENISNEAKEIIAKALQYSEDKFNTAYQLHLKKRKKKTHTGGFDIIAQTQAQADIEKKAINRITNELKQIGLQVKDFHDFFQIDDSVKFAETFMKSEGGFSGGSIGSTVEQQINNINQMLAWGGITPLDSTRLMSMVLNAGDALIGANQRSALENYFTTVGSMLMFRSGGNVLRQWSQEAQGYYNTNTTTKIHIYTFGTFYVPESYVLLKTYEALNECTNILLAEAKSTGSHAKIYNPVSDKDIINKGNVQQRWDKTANANYSKVKIEMVLMGGFLDLMDQMLSVMHNIN